MYSFHIEDMTRKVASAIGDFSDEGHAKIHKAIDGYWKDKIALTWSVGDVFHIAEKHHVEVTYDQARAILQRVLNEWDAEVGVNWDVLWSFTEEYLDGND